MLGIRFVKKKKKIIEEGREKPLQKEKENKKLTAFLERARLSGRVPPVSFYSELMMSDVPVRVWGKTRRVAAASLASFSFPRPGRRARVFFINLSEIMGNANLSLSTPRRHCGAPSAGLGLVVALIRAHPKRKKARKELFVIRLYVCESASMCVCVFVGSCGSLSLKCDF